jgi:hypothetical protein
MGGWGGGPKPVWRIRRRENIGDADDDDDNDDIYVLQLGFQPVAAVGRLVPK